MNNFTKRIIVLLTIFALLTTLFNSKANAEEYSGYVYEETFYAYETAEFQLDKNLSGLKYQINKDGLTVTAIGSYAINEQGNVDETSCNEVMIIPEKVTYNGVTYTVTATYETFMWKPVKNVTFPNSIINIGAGTIVRTNIEELEITANVETIDRDAIKFNANLKKLSVNKSNKNYTSSGNIIYTKNGKSLVLTANLGNIIKVKEGVENLLSNSLSNNVFYFNKDEYCNNVTEIYLPSTILLLENNSIPSHKENVDLIKFTGTKVPKINCDLVTGDDGPFLLVPKASISSYKKITYNGQKIDSNRVVSKLTNRYKNIDLLKKIDVKKAKQRPYIVTSAEFTKLKTFINRELAGIKTNEQKIIAIQNIVTSRVFVNEEFLGNHNIGVGNFAKDHPDLFGPYAVHTKYKYGTIPTQAMLYELTLYRAAGFAAIYVDFTKDGVSDIFNSHIAVLSDKQLYIIDSMTPLGNSYKGYSIDKTVKTRYFNMNQYLFNYRCKFIMMNYLDRAY